MVLEEILSWFIGGLILWLFWNNVLINLITIFNPCTYWDMFWMSFVIWIFSKEPKDEEKEKKKEDTWSVI